MILRDLVAAATLAAALVAAAAPSGAQPAAPVQSAPLAPPPAAAPSNPAPAAPAPTVPGPAAPAPPAQTDPAPSTPVSPGQTNPPPATSNPTASVPAPGRQTLVERPGDPSDVDEVTLVGRPAAILSGQSSWDKAVANLKASFKRIEDDLAKAGIVPTGRPIAVFTRTDDEGFRYDAMVPVAAAPEARPAGLDPELRFGATPAGRALRFVHKGPYDDVDTTYETITTYLDAKGVLVQDSFVEEYATDLLDGSDTGLEINIFALPR